MTYPWYEKGHQVYRGVLIFQFAMTLLVGLLTDTFVLGAIVGLTIVSLPLILFKIASNASFTRHIAVIATQLFAALHIQQTMGITYMHFEIFAVMAVTTVYRDWKVVASGVVVVAVHHIGFYLLQSMGSPVYIFEEAYMTLFVLGVHAFFAVAEGLILAFISLQSHKDGRSAFELSEAISFILKDEDHINLDITTTNDTKSLKEFSNLISTFAGVINQTKTVAKNLNVVSDTVQGLSEDVKQASLDTSSQVTTIATATEEMTANNESVAQRAVAVTDLSNDSKDASNKAKSIVEESNSEVITLKQDLSNTSNALSNLADKCVQIDNLMSSIKAISEQTNLLALNAAIESARAGEHGRGFAVVADEVRQLAMRTKDNTVQISDITASLISESKLSVESMQTCLSRSETVSNSSNSAKTIIDSVVESISAVSENMLSVSSAIKEQSLASSEISKSTCQLENTSQFLSNNASASDNSLNDLNTQIKQLSSQLERFN